jgi:hypothetical protein
LAIGLDADVQAALTLAEQGHSVALTAHLAACLARRGAADFVIGLAALLLIAIGEAWHAGRIAVHQEHLASEILARTLGSAALALQAGADRRAAPVAVLATLPEESHGLGLAMLEVTLAAQGGLIINLGTQLPPAQLAEAAAHHRAQVVAVSFSSFFRPAAVAPLLGALRRACRPPRRYGPAAAAPGSMVPCPKVTRFSSLGQADACAGSKRWVDAAQNSSILGAVAADLPDARRAAAPSHSCPGSSVQARRSSCRAARHHG